MMSSIKHISRIILFLFIAFGVGSTVIQAQEDENARPRLRAVNASLGLPSADVYVGGTLYFQDVYYSAVSKYAPVSATNLRLEIRPAGVTDVDPIQARDWSFENNKDYTMVIVGTREDIETPWMIEDNNKEPLVPGEARVRSVHAASTVSAVEICLDNRCSSLVYRTSSDYITLDEGHYNAKLRFIGTDQLFIYKLPTAFQSGQVYSIFIFDPQQGEIKPRILLLSDTGQELPHYPEKPHYPPGGPGKPPVHLPYPPGSGAPAQPPIYPPLTGAVLSPTALMALLIVAVLFGTVIFWFARRRQLQKF